MNNKPLVLSSCQVGPSQKLKQVKYSAETHRQYLVSPYNIRKWLLTDVYYKKFSIKKILNFKVPNVHNQAYRIIFRIKTITMTQFMFVNGCVIFNICANMYYNIGFLYESSFYDSSHKYIHLKVCKENYALAL